MKILNNLATIFVVLISNVIIGKAGHNSHHKHVAPHHKVAIGAPELTEKIGSNRTIVVDPNGKGDYKTVQSAINAVPDGNPNWILIHLRKGVYREKVHIPRSKPNIFMRGNGKGRTYIVWSQSSTDNIESATFKVEAPNFVAFGLSIKNDAPTGEAYTSQNQSVAAYVAADKVAFYHCGFFSTHNTLFDLKGRHYYEACYIQGSIDFIFGRARSLFHDCEIFVLVDRRIKIHGSITAHNRESANEPSGYVFNKGKIYGTGQVYLGRAKGAYSRVIFANTYFSGTVTAEGWTSWSYDGSTDNLYHAEYACHGPGSSTGERAPWSRRLSDEEVAPFLSIDFIDGKQWVPAWLD
ncbi:probable pectinesterase 67 [Beta vulgaris subsp. vulgaris]|uniref:probable pectinesterase 67 n=1 Tax=Beta vulgaris subsp. vulgaris TaxID=3555 RepID=UPI0020371C79|nr:probable pectinesterase 67 [Beta vulgaris subsp. vulgaris]